MKTIICKIVSLFKEIQYFFKYYQTLKPEFQKYENYAKKQERISNACTLIMFVFPLIIGALILLQEHPALINIFDEKQLIFDKNNILILVLFIFSLIAILAGIVHFIINPKDSNFIAEAMRATKLTAEMEEREILLYQIKREFTKSTYTLAAIDTILISAFSILNASKTEQIKKLPSFITFTVNMIYDALDRYKFEGERFSVAIYLYDEDRNLLVDIMSTKDKQIINDKKMYSKNKKHKFNKGREWALTDASHVSHVFNGGEGIIFGNLNKSINPKSQKSLISDEENYVSSITIPIRKRTQSMQNIKNRGVLCITSSEEDSFLDNEEYQILDILKKTRQRHISTISRIIEFVFNQIHPDSNMPIINIMDDASTQKTIH